MRPNRPLVRRSGEREKARKGKLRGNVQPSAPSAYRTPHGGRSRVPPPANVNEPHDHSPEAGTEWSIVTQEHRARWLQEEPPEDRTIEGPPLTQDELEELMATCTWANGQRLTPTCEMNNLVLLLPLEAHVRHGAVEQQPGEQKDLNVPYYGISRVLYPETPYYLGV